MQARPLLAARDRGEETCAASADLGRTTTTARLTKDGVAFAARPDAREPGDAAATTEAAAGQPREPPIAWSVIETVADEEKGCYEVHGEHLERIQVMSAHSGRLASLWPTEGPPALLLSGTLMHRIKGVDPGQDTQAKLAPLKRLAGTRLLDTATGLGYTAIGAAQAGAQVTTVEWDPAVVEVQRRNPWSAELFTHESIDRREGDIAEIIGTFGEHTFDRVLHDPPAFELAGDLYGLAFYRQLWGVLAPGGRLFHYIGNPDSPSGARVTNGVRRRLQEAGFRDVRREPVAFGVSARG